MNQSQHASTPWIALGASLLVALCACGDGDESEPADTTLQTTSGGGAGGQGGSGASGPGDCSCYACAPFMAACQAGDGQCPADDPAEVMCESSLAIVQALTTCLCTTGGCADLCPSMCSPDGGEDVEDECLACKIEARETVCASQREACQADTECPE